MEVSRHNFEVSQIEQNNLMSMVVFEIVGVAAMIDNGTCGEYVRSTPFDWNFPLSIGKSTWVCKIFFNGQYFHDESDDYVNVYMEMIRCENLSARLKFDATFVLGDNYFTYKKPNQAVSCRRKKTKWFGSELMRVSHWAQTSHRFIKNDSLTLSVYFHEHNYHEDEAEPKPSTSSAAAAELSEKDYNFEMENIKSFEKYKEKDIDFPLSGNQDYKRIGKTAYYDIYPSHYFLTSSSGSASSNTRNADTKDEYSSSEDDVLLRKPPPKPQNAPTRIAKLKKIFTDFMQKHK